MLFSHATQMVSFKMHLLTKMEIRKVILTNEIFLGFDFALYTLAFPIGLFQLTSTGVIN